MQGRILRKPIKFEKFKSLCDYLRAHLPNQITINGKPVDLSSIRFYSTFAGCGLADKAKQPIFIQVYTLPQPFQYFLDWIGIQPMLLSAIPYEQLCQIINALPNDWQAIYLKCLHPIPDNLKIFQAQEAAIVRRAVNTQAQAVKTIPQQRPSITDIDLLECNVGLFYLHNHMHLESWLFLCDRMGELARRNVKYFYVEMDKILLSPLFAEFHRTGNEALLQEHFEMHNLAMPELIPLFYQLIVTAKRHGISVLPVDSGTTTPEDFSTVEKVFSSNQRRDKLIAANVSLCQQQYNNPKFIALFGALHYSAAQKLNVPAALMLTDGKAVSINTKRHPSAELNDPFEINEKDMVIKLPSMRPKKPCCSLLRFGLFSIAATAAVLGAAVKLLQFSDADRHHRNK